MSRPALPTSLLLLLLFLPLLAVVDSRLEPLLRLPSDKDGTSPMDEAAGTRWAVLIAGSSGYGNYRHQNPRTVDASRDPCTSAKNGNRTSDFLSAPYTCNHMRSCKTLDAYIERRNQSSLNLNGTLAHNRSPKGSCMR